MKAKFVIKFVFQRHFYGPQERWMNIPGIFSFGTISKFIASRNTPGNMKGEGRLLGGKLSTFVL